MTEAAPRGSLLGRLLSESAVYGFGGAANQLLAVVLVPIYANVLGVTNYGVLAIVNTTLSLSTMVITLALPQAFFRSYLKEAETEEEREHVLRTSLLLRLLLSAGGLGVFTLLAIPLASLLVGGSSAYLTVVLIGPIVFFDTLNVMPLSFLRAERRAATYASLSFSRAVLGSLLIILFVVILRMGVLGVLVGSVLASMVVTGAGMVVLARGGHLRFGFDRRLVRHMLVFSIPLAPASVAGWTLNLSDRYLVQAFQGHAAVGVYSAGYTIGLLINALAISPFSLAWGAAYWEIARMPAARERFVRVMTAFTVFASFVALGLSALATDGLRLVFRPEFAPSRFVVPFSAFAYVCYGLYAIGATGLNLESQTRWVSVSMAVAAVFNVLVNLLLIPQFGYMGAAISTLASYALLATLTTAISQRYYPVRWDLPRTLAALLLGLGLAGAALLGPDSLLWRLACVAAYPIAALTLRIVHPDDVRAARRLLAARLRTRGVGSTS